MKLVRYICTHCGKKFEAEEREVLECPSCFWSTSVKREDDAPRASSAPKPEKKTGRAFPLGLIPALLIAAVLALGLFFISLIAPAAGKFFGKSGEKPAPSVEIEGVPAAEPGAPAKDKARPKKGGEKQPPPASPSAGITQEEQNVLNRRLDFSTDRPLSPEEEKILKNKAGFSTGFVERLPSQTWTLEQFKNLIAQQERYYQVPLPGSYKKKLYDLFTAKYQAAVEAFKNEKLLEARNLWVESLAFPIYSNSIQRHRAVALTMMRSYINDTLAKIGTVSSSMAERTIRVKEKEMTEVYAKLLAAVDKKSWQEAYGHVVDLQRRIEDFSRPDHIVGELDPYPPAIAQVDEGIRPALFEYLHAPTPATADIEDIRKDVHEKRKVIQSFLPENLEPVQQRYKAALDAISRKDWTAAENELKTITFPIALAQDAAEKIRILKKMEAPDQEAAARTQGDSRP